MEPSSNMMRRILLPYRDLDRRCQGAAAARVLWRCPLCGAPMGAPVLRRYHEAGIFYWAHNWENPCRCPCSYFDLRPRSALPPFYRLGPSMMNSSPFARLRRALTDAGFTLARCQDDTRDLAVVLRHGDIVGRITDRMELSSGPWSSAAPIELAEAARTVGIPDIETQLNRQELW